MSITGVCVKHIISEHSVCLNELWEHWKSPGWTNKESISQHPPVCLFVCLSVCLYLRERDRGSGRGFRLCGVVSCCDFIGWLFLAAASNRHFNRQNSSLNTKALYHTDNYKLKQHNKNIMNVRKTFQEVHLILTSACHRLLGTKVTVLVTFCEYMTTLQLLRDVWPKQAKHCSVIQELQEHQDQRRCHTPRLLLGKQRCQVPPTSCSGASEGPTCHLWQRLQMNHTWNKLTSAADSVSIRNTWQINAGHQRNRNEIPPKQICLLS